jgi:hypothetical protein
MKAEYQRNVGLIQVRDYPTASQLYALPSDGGRGRAADWNLPGCNLNGTCARLVQRSHLETGTRGSQKPESVKKIRVAAYAEVGYAS